jgi:hypothetical protein
MQPLQSTTLKAFNSLLAEQKQLNPANTRLTLMLFNHKSETVVDNRPLAAVPDMSATEYQPGLTQCSTSSPLYEKWLARSRRWDDIETKEAIKRLESSVRWHGSYRRHRQILEEIRDAVAINAPSIEFLEFIGCFTAAEQTIEEGWIFEVAVFAGRKLSYYVHIFDDRHLTLFVRDIYPGLDKPRKMVRHDPDPRRVVWMMTLLEDNGVATVRPGDNDPPIYLRDRFGVPVLAY